MSPLRERALVALIDVFAVSEHAEVRACALALQMVLGIAHAPAERPAGVSAGAMRMRRLRARKAARR